MEDQTVRQNVSFREFDYRIISEFAAKKGLDFSSAVRVIVREWEENQQLFSKPNPNITIDEASHTEG